MNKERIYIVVGIRFEKEDEYSWIEEIFNDKRLAELCCIYKNDYSSMENYHILEYEICTYNYGGYDGARETIKDGEFISFIKKEK